MPRRTSHIANLHQPLRRRVQRIARTLLLLFVAWQGPLPWCHCHGTLTNCPDGARDWLASHLGAYHAADALFGDRSMGWHFHAVMPGSSDNGPAGNGPAGKGPAGWGRDLIPPTSASDGLTLLTVASARGENACPLAVALHDQPHLRGAVSFCRVDARSFYESFAPSLALPLRFGIMRS